MVNLEIRDFEIQLREIISQSNLPVACVSSIIKNILFEIDLLKEQQYINELVQQGPPMESEIKSYTNEKGEKENE